MRLIIVDIGTPQTLYVGKTELTENQIDEHIIQGKPIGLMECRCLRTILQFIPPAGINQKDMVTALPIARQDTTMRIVPRGYWWPDEDKEGMQKLKQLIESCKKVETEERSGLVS